MTIMLDFHQKRKVKAFLYNRFTLICLFLVVLLMLQSVWSVYKKKVSSEEMRSIALKNVEELKVREGELKTRIDRLGTDSGIEEEIRSKFNVAKENENIVIVVEEKDAVTSTTTQKRSFLGKFLDLFKESN